MAESVRFGWHVPALLILLIAFPVVAGIYRLSVLAGAGEITPENVRFFEAPVPVVVHILGAIVYCILGAFQFAPGFRRRHPGWHRAAGRLLIPSGLAVAFTGLWMAQFYPLPEYDGQLLYVFRQIFGWGMVASILLGLAAVLRRDFASHRAWMMRGYAIGLGAGTQTVLGLPWVLAFGMPDGVGRALMMGAGWGINLAVAEWAIRGWRLPARAAASA